MIAQASVGPNPEQTGEGTILFNGLETPVVFAGMSHNAQGSPDKRAVWITNRHGKTSPLHIDMAIKFVNKEGNRYKFATTDEIPFVPEEKIYPYDAKKSPEAQMSANTTHTGREVAELAEKNQAPNVSKLTWQEVRKAAKDAGINTYGRPRVDIEAELQGKGLL